MRVYEIFKKANKDKVAKILKENHSESFKKKKDAEVFYSIFLDEISKIKVPIKLKRKEEDLVVLVNMIYVAQDVTYKQGTKDFDVEAYKYYTIDGIHTKDILKYRDEIGMTMRELELKRDIDYNKGNFLHTYGLDLLDRDTILSLNLASINLEKYSPELIAAEVTWEMTFYGLTNKKIEKRQKEVKRVIKDSISKLKKSLKKDGSIKKKKYEKHFGAVDLGEFLNGVPEETIEEKKYRQAVDEANRNRSKQMLQDYVTHYENELQILAKIRRERKE